MQSKSNKPTVAELSAGAGIAKSHASMVLRGLKPPSERLAIFMFRTWGWKHDSIAHLTGVEIDVLEKLKPWCPEGRRRVAA